MTLLGLLECKRYKGTFSYGVLCKNVVFQRMVQGESYELVLGLSIYFLYNIIFASMQHNSMILQKIIQWDPEESQMT